MNRPSLHPYFLATMVGVTYMAGAGCQGAEPRASATPVDASTADWFTKVPAGRSIVRAGQAMVATSQPLASQVGIDILKRGGNAV